jgi:purine-nucleoside phosphorylase
MSEPYDPAARAIVRNRALKAGIDLKEGVYAQMLGPAYETASEIGMLRRLGAHAVGMSTVPETIAARHAGLRVLGISMITNDCLGKEAGAETTHEEVLNVAEAGRDRLARLLDAILPSLARVADSPAFRA